MVDVCAMDNRVADHCPLRAVGMLPRSRSGAMARPHPLLLQRRQHRHISSSSRSWVRL